MNIVIAIGEVLEDTTLKISVNGKESVTLKVVVPRISTEGKTLNEIIEVSFWDKKAKYITEYVHKGDVVSVEGSLAFNGSGYTVYGKKITKLKNKNKVENYNPDNLGF